MINEINAYIKLVIFRCYLKLLYLDIKFILKHHQKIWI